MTQGDGVGGSKNKKQMEVLGQWKGTKILRFPRMHGHII